MGEKRRKGRPKNLPYNCLAPSPVHARKPQEILELDERGNVPAPVRKTTKRKRKAPEEVDDIEKDDHEQEAAQSPVQSLHRQFRIHSGLRDPKPPKKKKKTGRETNPSPSDSISAVSPSKPSPESVKKPTPVVCKKKKGSYC